MPSLRETLKRRSFWIVARVCFALYRWFPLFGSLRASVGIIYRDGKFLVIQRNDGRGVSLPGGIASRSETEEVTLRREVMEESGMRVIAAEERMRYHSTADVPCNITVFCANADGELKDSWEGAPRWMSFEEIEARMLESQRPVLTIMRRMAGGG